MAVPEEYPSVPHSDEVQLHTSNLEERLANYISQEEAALRSIRAKGNISLGLWAEVPAHDIVADFGGKDQVERLVGTKLANELSEEIIREG